MTRRLRAAMLLTVMLLASLAPSAVVSLHADEAGMGCCATEDHCNDAAIKRACCPCAPGSPADPPATVNGATLTWSLADIRTSGTSLTYEVRPRRTGHRPTNIDAMLDYVDATGQSGQATFPVPYVDVHDVPIQLDRLHRSFLSASGVGFEPPSGASARTISKPTARPARNRGSVSRRSNPNSEIVPGCDGRAACSR